jgi:hypothetical protein
MMFGGTSRRSERVTDSYVMHGRILHDVLSHDTSYNSSYYAYHMRDRIVEAHSLA